MPLPNTMQALVVTGTASHQLLLQSIDTPVPIEDEVLIKVAAAGVNRPDVLQRRGLYPPPPGASPYLGLEVAGEVVACGAKVTRWQVGQKVCALTNGGGYAQYCVAPEGQTLPVPEGLTLLQAAALPETFFTVWHNVFERAALQNGETLLVHGGTSGIGTTAIQLAQAMGARVFCTAGSAQKCEAARQLGAALAINYRTEDFVQRVKAAGGADVILDMVGGEYIARNVRAARPDGRIVNIAFLAGSRAALDFARVMLKRLTLTGSTLRAQSPQCKAAIAKQLYTRVWPLLARGVITPVIAAKFTPAEASRAHELMESSQHIGKIVLDFSYNSARA